jgi:hypothetical protein
MESIEDLGYLTAVQKLPAHPVQFHQYMLSLCFRAFSADFQKNLRGLEEQDSIQRTSYKKIPKYLQSASIIWLVHLNYILDSEALEESQISQVMDLFEKHILHWIECMAVLWKLYNAVDMLKQIEVSRYVSICILL